jgi:hypothetical protein
MSAPAGDGLDFTLERQVVLEGYDRESEWFQPRIGVIPPSTAVMTLTRADLTGSDAFSAIRSLHSNDLGRTWSDPVEQDKLDRILRPEQNVEEVPCDITPRWHAATGKLLATGHTTAYQPGDVHPIVNNSIERFACYAVYDAQTGCWPRWDVLAKPDPREQYHWMTAGCADRVDLPDGSILLPTYNMSREDVGENFWQACFFTCVVKCRFDGEKMEILEVGDELSVPEPRGLCEPSLVQWGGRFFLTLRNDVRAYVTAGDDGLHFPQPQPWRFDDGEELGSINTQQHWIAHSEGLYLVYTRKGLDNDEIFRWRAPLMIARVDPERLVVLRETERELLPKLGATLGNFGTIATTVDESWVTVAEGMQNGDISPESLLRAEAAGANNRVYLARIRWNRPNLLAAVR